MQVPGILKGIKSEMQEHSEIKEKFSGKDILRIIWMGIKLAIVIYAIFQTSNLTILYQGF